MTDLHRGPGGLPDAHPDDLPGAEPDDLPGAEPRYAVAPGVPWVDGEELGLTDPVVYVAPSHVGPPLVLKGSAWAVWTALAEAGGSIAEVTSVAAELTGTQADDIAADVAAFVSGLTESGAVVAVASPDRDADPDSEPSDSAPAPFFVEAFGVLVEVIPPDGATSARWRRQWARSLAAPGTPQATLDAATVMQESEATTDYKMATQVTHLALDHSVDRLNLHAAGLVDDHGRALALIAPSGTGKTTATRELGRRLGYLSDETVSVGPDLGVLPHPKPLSFVDDPSRPHHKSQLGPDDLGLRRATVPARLQRIVLLQRLTDRSSPDDTDHTGDTGDTDHTGDTGDIGDTTATVAGLAPLSIAEGIAAILPQTSYVTSLTDPLLRIATVLQATGGAQRLTYVEISDHVDDLVALLDSPPEPDAGLLVHHPSALPATGPEGTLARAPWHDAVELDEAVVVLVDGTSYQLEGLGATIWLALEQARTPADLLEVAREVHGDHPDAERLVAEGVASLEELGIVVASERITLPSDDPGHDERHDHAH